jgi:hypothetical protein
VKHVNEPRPSLLGVRRDVPVRVANAVERALAKDPGKRFDSMDSFAGELEACLTSLDGVSATDDADATLITRQQPDAGRDRAVSTWAMAVAALGGIALAAVIVALVALRGDNGKPKGRVTPVTHPVHLAAVGTWDPPPGDGHEHNELVVRAVDHNTSTYWETETYNDFASSGKKGVGLVLGAGRAAPAITRVTVQTDTPGFSAQLLTGTSLGRFHAVTGSQQVQNGTTFQVDRRSIRRYLVLWLTKLPINYAHVNEVRAGT